MINRCALVAACAIATTLTAGCGQPALPGGDPGTSPAPSVAPVSADGAFIAATAAHLCRVQSTVYPDAASLAAAHAATPDYGKLTPSQVQTFKQRLTSDPTFSAQLKRQLTTTCRPTPAPSAE